MKRFFRIAAVISLLCGIFSQIGCLDKDRASKRKRAKLEKELNEAFKQGDTGQIEKKMLEAIEMDPKATHLKNSLAILYAFNLKEYDKAKVLWEELIKKEPKNSAYLNNLAGIYQITGDYDRAISLYDEAKKFRQDYHMPYYNVGKILITQGKYQEAIDELREGIKKTKRDSIMIFTLARAIILNGQLEDAATYLKEEIAKGEYSLENNFLLERLLIRLKRFDEAAAIFDTLIARYPEHLATIKAEYLQFLVFRRQSPELIQMELSAFQKIGDPQKFGWMDSLIQAGISIVNGDCSQHLDQVKSLEGKIGEEFFQFEAARLQYLGLCYELAGQTREADEFKMRAFNLTPEMFDKPEMTEPIEPGNPVESSPEMDSSEASN